MTEAPLKKRMLTEEMIWIGDGFNSAKDQIGRRVNIDGRTGVVTHATELFITVKFDRWCPWKGFLKRIWWCNDAAYVDDAPLLFCQRPWFHRGVHRTCEGKEWPR